MGSFHSLKVYVNNENLNRVDTIVNDQLEINPTLMCKPMLQFQNQKFPDEPGINLIQLKIQSTPIQKPNQLDLQDFPQLVTILPKRGSLSPTQKGILKTQLSQMYSSNTLKKKVRFDKAKKKLSIKSLMESQNNRREKVTMEMLEATF